MGGWGEPKERKRNRRGEGTSEREGDVFSLVQNLGSSFWFVPCVSSRADVTLHVLDPGFLISSLSCLLLVWIGGCLTHERAHVGTEGRFVELTNLRGSRGEDTDS